VSGRHNTDEQRTWAPAAAAAAAAAAITPPAALAAALGCAGSGYLTDRVDLAATGAIAGGIGLAAERWSSRTLRRRLRRERAQFRWETQSLQASVDELRRELTEVMRTLESLRSTATADVAVTGGIVVADRAARAEGHLPGTPDGDPAGARTREIDLGDLERFAPPVPAAAAPVAGAGPAAAAPPQDPPGHVPAPSQVPPGALPVAARPPGPDTAASEHVGPEPVGSDWFSFRPARQPAADVRTAAAAGGQQVPDTRPVSLFQPVVRPGTEQVASPFQPAVGGTGAEPDTASTPLPLLMPGPRASVFSPPHGMSLLAGETGARGPEPARELILPDSVAWVRDLRPAVPVHGEVDEMVREVLQEAGEITRGGPALDRLARQEDTGEILVVGAGTNVRSLAGAMPDRRGRHLA